MAIGDRCAFDCTGLSLELLGISMTSRVAGMAPDDDPRLKRGRALKAKHRYEEAARTLGGSEWYVFRRVTLPAIRPAVLTGAVLTWARALGEFGATITFAGSLPGITRTMPLETYLALETDPDRAVLLSLLLVAISFAVLYTLRGRWVGAALRGGRP